jgi:hypothetical protein
MQRECTHFKCLRQHECIAELLEVCTIKILQRAGLDYAIVRYFRHSLDSIRIEQITNTLCLRCTIELKVI